MIDKIITGITLGITLVCLVLIGFLYQAKPQFSEQPFGAYQPFVEDQKTAFGELEMAELSPLLQIAFNYNINSRQVSSTATNIGSASQSNNLAQINTGASANSTSTIFSLSEVKYNPGQGTETRFTALFTQCKSASNQYIGVFDDNNGFAFGCQDDHFGVLRRQNGTDTFTPTSMWNVDKMDGTGPSGQTIDITKGQVMIIEYQWLGFGGIEFLMEDSKNGKLTLVHRIKYANANTIPSIFNPTLPIRATVENATNTTDMILKTGSWAGFVQGKNVERGLKNASSTQAVTIGTTEIPVLTLQNNSTFQGITNKVEIILDLLTMASEGNKPISVIFTKNATLTGTSFVDTNSSTSVSSVDFAASALSGGDELLVIDLGKTDSELIKLKDLEVILEPGETITVSAISTGAGGDLDVGINWEELF